MSRLSHQTGCLPPGFWSDPSLLCFDYSILEWECLFCVSVWWKYASCFYVVEPHLRHCLESQMRCGLRSFKLLKLLSTLWVCLVGSCFTHEMNVRLGEGRECYDVELCGCS